MNVYIATPAYSQTTIAEYNLSLIQTIHALSQKEIGFGVSILPGDCFVANARNRLVTEFLESPCTDLFFIDDDIQWKPEDFIKILEAPFEVIAGIYPQKLDVHPQQFPVELSCNEDGLIVKEHEGKMFYQANSIPAGFMRIRRSVIENMASELSERWYEWPETNGSLKKHIAFFEAGVCYEEHKFHGEDYNFSMKLRSMGFDLWTLPDLDFTHIGKKKYQGNLQGQIDKLFYGEHHDKN